MPTLVTSASTDAQVEAAYDDNSSYSQGQGNVAMAQMFQAACRILKRRYPISGGQDGTTLSRNLAGIDEELKAVDRWLNVNDSNQRQTPIIGDTRWGRW